MYCGQRNCDMRFCRNLAGHFSRCCEATRAGGCDLGANISGHFVSTPDMQNHALHKIGPIFGTCAHANVPVAVTQFSRRNIRCTIKLEFRFDIITNMRRAANDCRKVLYFYGAPASSVIDRMTCPSFASARTVQPRASCASLFASNS